MTEVVVAVSEEKNGINPHFPRPKEIGQVQGFSDPEVSLVAGRLVEFFRSENMWRSFGLWELIRFYNRRKFPKADRPLFGLRRDWHDLKWFEPEHQYLSYDVQSGRYQVTDLFILQCQKHINKQAA